MCLHSYKASLYTHQTLSRSADLRDKHKQAHVSWRHGEMKHGEMVHSCCTRVAGTTLAAVVIGQLGAAVCSPGVTRVGQTLIDVALAAFPDVSCRADAVVPPHSVHAAPMVKALGLLGDGVGEGRAVVNVDLAVNT